MFASEHSQDDYASEYWDIASEHIRVADAGVQSKVEYSVQCD